MMRTKLTPDVLALVRQMLSDSPRAWGVPRDCWTLRAMAKALAAAGVDMSHNTVRQAMHACGAVHVRLSDGREGRRLLPHARDAVASALRSGLYCFADETRVGAHWARRGVWSVSTTARVARVDPMDDPVVYVMAALTKGPDLAWAVDLRAPNSASWGGWAGQVVKHAYGELSREAVVVCDGATFHRTPVARRLLGCNLSVLPARCSSVNPMEQVWTLLQAQLDAPEMPKKVALWDAVRRGMEAVASDTTCLARILSTYDQILLPL